jgi:hypothetical protein
MTSTTATPTVEDTQAAECLAWQVRAQAVIANRLEDARSHAETGRTRAADRSLDELEQSLSEEIIGPAREQFFRRSFADQRSQLDPEIVDLNCVATPDCVRAARRAPIGGDDQYGVVRSMVDDARRQLKLVAGVGENDPTARAAYHEMWQCRHRAALTSTVKTALSDAQMSLFNVVGQLMIRSDIR